MNCAYDNELAAYLDGELGPAEEAAVEAHLAGCERCRREAELLRRSYAALEYIGDVEAPAGFARKVSARTRRRAPRAAFAFTALAAAAALVIAFAIGIERRGTTVTPETRVATAEEMAIIENANVLENLDVLAEFDIVENLDTIQELDQYEGLVAAYSGGAL